MKTQRLLHVFTKDYSDNEIKSLLQEAKNLAEKNYLDQKIINSNITTITYIIWSRKIYTNKRKSRS